jgi:uncharacterized protein YdcH (DUF465 family)
MMMKAIAGQRLAELERHHRELDYQVSRLERRAYLTPTEQHVVSNLKKEKLRAKDEIALLKRG